MMMTPPVAACTCSCGLNRAVSEPVSVESLAEGSIGYPDIYGDWQDEDGEFSQDISNFDVQEETASQCAEAEMTSLRLQVRALQRYKTNYELLCGQLSELSEQIGLQLQRHEADVAALQTSIADLQTEKLVLEARASEAEQALALQREAARQGTEYSERQLSTAAELLKATEERLEDQERHYTAGIDRLKAQLLASNEECAEYHASAKGLEKELESLRKRVNTTHEQGVIHRQREKIKHNEEVAVLTTKLQSLTDKLETLRLAMRGIKKQLRNIQADNDVLRKQIVNVRRDGSHLSIITDSQSNEHEMNTKHLVHTKKEKKKLAEQVAGLSQEVDQLSNELSIARGQLVASGSELQTCQIELRDVRSKLQLSSHAISEAVGSNAKLIKQVESLERAQDKSLTSIKMRRERKYLKEIARTRKLLSDNDQRVAESTNNVQTLRGELLGVRRLLHSCRDDKYASKPTDQWADIMRSSIPLTEKE